MLTILAAAALGWQIERYQDPLHDKDREISAVYRRSGSSLTVACHVSGRRYSRIVRVETPEYLQSDRMDVVEWRFDQDEPRTSLWSYFEKRASVDNAIEWMADSFIARLRTADRLVLRLRDSGGSTVDVMISLPQDRASLLAVVDRCNRKAIDPL